jgi:hypothetical protein
VRYDPEPVVLRWSKHFDELKFHEKEILKQAFNYRKRFELEVSTIRNCIFVRQMKEFIYEFNTFDKTPEDKKEKAQDGFYQKALYIMKEGKRIQMAILAYLCERRAPEVSVTLALRMDIDRDDWPSGMKNISDSFVNSIRLKIDRR